MKFDWEHDAEIEPETYQAHPPYWRWLQFGLVLIVLSGLAGGSWWRVRSAENALRQSVQDVLDLEVAAAQIGDGEQFFTFFPNDSAYRFSTIQSNNHSFYFGNPQVTRVEQREGVIWANVTYELHGQTLQRLLFFDQTENGLRHRARDAAFWGDLQRTRYPWGTLVIREVDEEWRIELAAAVQRVIDQYPAALTNNLGDYTLIITDEFSPIAVDTASFPSPRLWGLDAEGMPSAAYWTALNRAISAQFALEQEITLRFAVEVGDTTHGYVEQDARFRQIGFQSVADAYMREHPNVTIEIVDLSTLPADPVARMGEVDGAIMPLSADLITSGAILDLTKLAEDPTLERGDFYEQIWQGGYWQDRLWQLPFSAQMRMMFYDEEMVESTETPPPWTFSDYANLIAAVGTETDKSGLLLSSPDLLYAHAFAHNNDALDRAQAAASLQWLSQVEGVRLVNQYEPALRRQQVLTILSSRRKAATWVDVPKEYEYHSLLKALGVAPFPSSERLTSVAPLWIEGGMISSTSQNPRAVWDWLIYLSHEAPKLNRRLIPARPSVALETNFWQTVPEPLNDVMRNAFPTARAVTVEDRRYFSADAIANNRAQPIPLIWFNR